MSASGLVSQAGHAILRSAVSGGQRRFQAACKNIERVQRAQLAALLQQVAAVDARIDAQWRWEDFGRQVPVSGWNTWRNLAERQRATGERLLIDSPTVRYQPTSGSTSAIKWVPYTQKFLGELDAAIAPWLADLYGRFPGVRKGHHYWSLSWLPTEMRASQSGAGDLNDDMAMLSVGKRALAKLTQAVPQDTALANTSDDSLFMTLAFLAADEKLSALSVWSPTFALNLLQRLGDWRWEIAEVLAYGNWGLHADGARHVRCPRSLRAAALLRGWNGKPDPDFFRQLWPALALVSAWDTAAAGSWAARLRELLPQASFQGKGLWATEGVVTIPQGERHVLAAASHVYEFEDVESKRVLAPWQLRAGQRVRPLLSTGSGLLRYRMSDVLECDGFYHAAPTLRFLGRDDGTDLVGEKLAAVFVQNVLDSLPADRSVLPVSVLALDDAAEGRPGYVLLAEAIGSTQDRSAQDATGLAMAAQIEQAFCGHFHYQLARNLGQIDAVRAVVAPDMQRLYAEHCQRHGMIAGNVKVEPLRHWRDGVPDIFRPIAAGTSVGSANKVVPFRSRAQA